jgi:predicted RNA-binding protein with RPS1 domain
MPFPPALSDEARAELEARRAELRRKADRRRNQPGFAAKVREFDEWIAEIDADLGG